MMCVLSVICLLLCVSVHTAHSVLYYKTVTEGSVISLYCGNGGRVVWSKGVNGQRRDILTAKHGEETNPIKHNPDPDHRYSVFSDLSLNIRNLSLSDSGIYYCNNDTVYNLTVTAGTSTTNPSTSPPPVECTGLTSTINNMSTTMTPAATPSQSSTSSSSETDATGISTVSSSTPSSTVKSTSKRQTSKKHQGISTVSSSTPSSTVKSTSKRQTSKKHQGISTVSSSTPSSTVKSTSKRQTSKKHQHQGISTVSSSTHSSTVKSTSKGQTSTKHQVVIIVPVLVSVVTVLVAVLLWRCFFKKKTVKDSKTNPLYESIEDVKPAANENQYEGVYVLAGDPAIVNLENKSHTEPSSSSDSQSPKSEGDPVYHTIQNEAVTQS